MSLLGVVVGGELEQEGMGVASWSRRGMWDPVVRWGQKIGRSCYTSWRHEEMGGRTRAERQRGCHRQ